MNKIIDICQVFLFLLAFLEARLGYLTGDRVAMIICSFASAVLIVGAWMLNSLRKL